MPLPPPNAPAPNAVWSAWALARAPLEWGVAFLPPAALQRLQSARVTAIVRHAYAHVPYYRETMRSLGLTPADLRTADDLARLPIVERDDVARDPERFVGGHAPLSTMLERSSGGSTGPPLRVFIEPQEVFTDAVFKERRRLAYMRLARRFRYRETRVVYRPPYWRDLAAEFRARSYVKRGWRLARQDVSLLDPPEVNARRINELAPDVLFGHGSSLEALFVHAHLTGTELHRPKAVVYSNDHMSEPGRRLIRDGFGVPVLTAYGATECGLIGWSCERGEDMHVNSDICAVRIVDADGRDAPTGERGEVVVSNLVRRGTVLLNYRVGDVSALRPDRCGCGRTLPLLAGLRGRRGEYLPGREGDRLDVADLDAVAAEEAEVLRYRVAQRDRERLHVAVVAAPGEREGLESRLRERFAQRLGPDAEVTVELVDDLPRTPRGKVLTFVREEDLRPDAP